MVASMLKYAFILYHKDLDSFLNKLQTLGVVDIESHSTKLDDKASFMMSQISRYNTAYNQLKLIKLDKDEVITLNETDAETMLKQYEEIVSEQEQLNNKIKKLEKDIIDTRPWGIFSEDILIKMKGLGLTPHFYILSEKSFKHEWTDKYAIEIISNEKGWIYFLLLQHKGETIELDLQETKFTGKCYVDLESELSEAQQRLNEIIKTLKQFALSSETLLAEKNKITTAFDFQIAGLNATREAEGNIAIISGWIPEENNNELLKIIESDGILYLSDKPTEEDTPPILLKNNKFTKLFEVITKLYSLPRYTEVDLTPFFAPFFMLFFALCLGDGGYGILIVIIATLLKFKLDKEYHSMLSLAQIFGAATVVVSFITTGGFFGTNIDQLNFVGQLEKKYNLPPNNGMLYLALIVGGAQVIFGMCINVYNIYIQKGVKYALSKLAWILFIISIGVYYLIGNNIGTGVYAIYAVMAASLLLIFFYNTPGKNIFVNFGGGIWDSYNTASGLLGDLLSYIRLFALGLTGGILGNVFNQLAFSLKSDNIIVSTISVGLVLIFGHTLNILLNTLGAFVHPLRLTFVEFYKNSGFDGGGKEYNPFKINQ